MQSARISTLAFVAVFAASYVHADPVRDALSEIAKCADITDSVARLKCFDAAVPRAKSALGGPQEKPKEAVAKDQGGSVQTFGLPTPDKPVAKVEDFGKPPAPAEGPKEITEIRSAVLEFGKTSRGKALFILENGQVWRQLDADSTNVLEPSTGTTMKVVIEKGWLSSYNLTIDGRNGLIKVTRLQ